MQRVIDILLIEPDSRHAMLIREGISKACPDCRVERVAEFDEAKALLHQGQEPGPVAAHPNPALIIIELLDPKKPKAAEFMRWLREDVRTKRLPVVVLGVEGDAYSVTKAYDLGGSSYLVKPRSEEEFVRMIETAAIYWTNLNNAPL
jgi:DNA-binding NarL/FixJ family response regulator